MLRQLFSKALFCAALCVSSAAWAAPISVSFNEAGAPGGQLDGTTFYQAQGIADFANSLRFTGDSRLLDDGAGITNSPSAVGEILFAGPVSNLQFAWATSGGGVSFHAEVFDELANLLGSFHFDGANSGASVWDTAGFAFGGIHRMTFTSFSDAQAAIDTLSFETAAQVPEPASLALGGLALLFAVGARRGRR